MFGMVILLVLVSLYAVFLTIYLINKDKKSRSIKYKITDNNQMVVVYNEDLNVVDVINPKDNLLLGFSRKTLINKSAYHFHRMVSEQNLNPIQKIVDTLYAVRETGKAEYFEYMMESPIDKQKYFALCHIAKHGEYLCASVWEVTEQNIIDANKDYSDRKLGRIQAVLKSTKQSVWQYNIRDDRFIVLSGDLELPSNLTYEQMLKYLSPSSRDLLEDIFSKMKSGEKETASYVVNTWMFARSSYRYARVSVILQRNLFGEPETVLGSIEDITQDVKKEERNNVIMDTISMVSKMKMGYLDVLSGHFYMMFGKDGFKDTGVTLDNFYARLHEECRHKFPQKIQLLLDGKKEDMILICRVWEETKKDYCYYKIVIRAEKDEQGKVHRLSGVMLNIDEEKRLELKVKQAMDLGEIIAEGIPVGICHYDEFGNLLKANRTILNMFGLTEETQCKLNFLDGCIKVSEDIKQRVLKGENTSYNTAYDINELEEMEYMSLLSDKVYYRVTIIQANRENHHNGFILFLYDVTEEIKHGKEIQELYSDLYLALEVGRMFVWRFDLETRRFYALRSEIRKFMPSTLSDNWKCLHPDDIPLQRSLGKSLISGKSDKSEAIFRYDFGAGYHTYDCKMVVKKDNGKVVSIIGALRDVTEEQKQSDELHNLYQQNKIILENINCGILFIDANKQVLWENTAFKKGSSYSSPLSFCISCKDEHLFECKTCALFRCFETKQVEESKYKVNECTYDIYGIPVWNGEVFLGVVARLDDVTQSERVLADLKKAKLEAEKADKLKSAFLANVSHEIRTPLNAIVGFSELLANEEQVDEKETFMEIIHKNTDLLLRLISDILDLSKIESGTMKITPREFDLRKLLDDRMLAAQKQIAENGQNITVSVESSLESLIIYQDPDRVNQVVGNFLTNASKYTKQGKIVLSLEQKDSGAMISVRDTGIGISKENQAKLFQRFSKLDSFAQGSGLGLAISKAVLDMCHGRIGCTSEGEGKGSTFWAWFPLRNVDVGGRVNMADRYNFS